MGNTVQWPDKPFYIQSKLNRSNYVLVVTETGAVALEPCRGMLPELWTAMPDPRGGAVLRHIASNLVLQCHLPPAATANPVIWLPNFGGVAERGELRACPFDPSLATQLFRAEPLADNWVGINALVDWEAKINVYNSNPNGTIGMWPWSNGSDNEEWLLIPEAGQLTIEKLDYDLDHAIADVGMPPAYCETTSVDNRQGGTPINSSYALARSITNSQTFTNSTADTTGTKYTETFGLKGIIDKLFEVTASASFEQSQSHTVTISDQKTQSQTLTDTITTQVNVPPGKKYSYRVVVHYGKLTIPYTMHALFHSSKPGVAPVPVTISGVFTGVNAVESEVVVTDLTTPQTAMLVRRLAIDAATRVTLEPEPA